MKISDKYLPIGTVVFLKNEVTMYMIIGYKDESLKNYISVPFPYGLMSDRLLNFFNYEEIQEVIYIGYKSDKF